MLITTLLLAAIPAIAAFENDPHFFVYPNRPQYFANPQVQRRSLLPFLKVRDLPMSGLVYLNRIKSIDNELNSSEEKSEDKKIGEEIDNVLQTLKENSAEDKNAVESKIASAPVLSSTSSPFPQPQIPFPWQRGLVQQEQQLNPFLRVRSAPTQFAHQPVVGSAYLQAQYPHYPYPILPQHLAQLRRDQLSGDELTVLASLPYGQQVGQAPASVQLLPVGGRRVVHSGAPHLSALDAVPFRAHGVSTHRGPLSDNKLVSISVFRLGQ
ncbi:hypothetical protein PRIPAC_86058 [Pristionchus pacificus]|uniref:Uncharacterized protein n=1 Tax=Pristionchus pacificus TaxID=54126 RepID=A0A2A6C9I7_PRIPA|nr:hypothetical protein PRIPAC_86058 [Pristionchus pacificus]|eukprot:PDM74872.1 hypothetical protein PRIPAC_43362 [Pristionchus pacificus]